MNGAYIAKDGDIVPISIDKDWMNNLMITLLEDQTEKEKAALLAEMSVEKRMKLSRIEKEKAELLAEMNKEERAKLRHIIKKEVILMEYADNKSAFA